MFSFFSLSRHILPLLLVWKKSLLYFFLASQWICHDTNWHRRWRKKTEWINRNVADEWRTNPREMHNITFGCEECTLNNQTKMQQYWNITEIVHFFFARAKQVGFYLCVFRLSFWFICSAWADFAVAEHRSWSNALVKFVWLLWRSQLQQENWEEYASNNTQSSQLQQQ